MEDEIARHLNLLQKKTGHAGKTYTAIGWAFRDRNKGMSETGIFDCSDISSISKAQPMGVNACPAFQTNRLCFALSKAILTKWHPFAHTKPFAYNKILQQAG